jgi:biopolymer transport protein ExbB
MSFVERAKNVLVSLGATWVLWLLLAASVFSVAVIVERWLALRVLRGDPAELRAILVDALRAGGMAAAREALGPFAHPAARIALRGLERADVSPRQAEDRMSAEAIAQRKVLERRFTVLASLGANAPFVGLLGTVIGILQAFDAFGGAGGSGAAGAAGAAGAEAGAALAPALVMSSIAEALVATAVGLAVAIPAVLAFNAFQRAVRVALEDARMLSLEVLAHMGEREASPRSSKPVPLSRVS